MSDDVYQPVHTQAVDEAPEQQQHTEQPAAETSGRLTQESIAALATAQRYYGASALQYTRVFDAVPKQRAPPLYGQALAPQTQISYATRVYGAAGNQ